MENSDVKDLEEKQMENPDVEDTEEKQMADPNVIKLAECSSFSDIISLIHLYQEEWIYRDTMFWKHAFKLFYASLIVTLLPFLTETLNIKIMQISYTCYPIVGLIIAFVFLFFFLSDATRSKAAFDSYNKIMDQLPEHIKRRQIKDVGSKYEKFFSGRIGIVICCIMFAGLLILSLAEIIGII